MARRCPGVEGAGAPQLALHRCSWAARRAGNAAWREQARCLHWHVAVPAVAAARVMGVSAQLAGCQRAMLKFEALHTLTHVGPPNIARQLKRTLRWAPACRSCLGTAGEGGGGGVGGSGGCWLPDTSRLVARSALNTSSHLLAQRQQALSTGCCSITVAAQTRGSPHLARASLTACTSPGEGGLNSSAWLPSSASATWLARPGAAGLVASRSWALRPGLAAPLRAGEGKGGRGGTAPPRPSVKALSAAVARLAEGWGLLKAL